MPAISQSDIVVVTGGGSGIGRALCEAVGRAGAQIVVADIELDRADAVASGMVAAGGRAVAMSVDVSDPASNQALADEVFARFGKVTHLFLNAGVGAGGALHTLNRKAIEWVFAVNVFGVIDGVRAFAGRMLEQEGPAHIIATGSEHSLGLPARGGSATPYTASKHAVLGLCEGMARDYAGTNLAVSIICPAVVQSDIWNSFRNRPERFGGPRQLDAKWSEENQTGLPAATAAARILDGLAAGEFYLFSHGRDVAEVSGGRADAVSAALERFSQRYGTDA